jgi:hypothetical protein
LSQADPAVVNLINAVYLISAVNRIKAGQINGVALTIGNGMAF